MEIYPILFITINCHDFEENFKMVDLDSWTTEIVSFLEY